MLGTQSHIKLRNGPDPSFLQKVGSLKKAEMLLVLTARDQLHHILLKFLLGNVFNAFLQIYQLFLHK